MSEYEWGVRYETLIWGEWKRFTVTHPSFGDAIDNLHRIQNADPLYYRNVQLVRRPMMDWEVVNDEPLPSDAYKLRDGRIVYGLDEAEKRFLSNSEKLQDVINREREKRK